MMENRALYSDTLKRGITKLGEPTPAGLYTIVRFIRFENIAPTPRTVEVFLNTRTPKRKLPRRYLLSKVRVPAGNTYESFLYFELHEGDYIEARTWTKASIYSVVGGFQFPERPKVK